MRKIFIILIMTAITALNINSYGALDPSVIESSKLRMLESDKQEEDLFEKSINWGLGSTIFKLIHFAELMFISEVSRKNVTN
jgi:hypothetical protein|tara:strand:+ start:39 stop:284 length:246 start_codon:yes stop_codon:yes gene_type:complete